MNATTGIRAWLHSRWRSVFAGGIGLLLTSGAHAGQATPAPPEGNADGLVSLRSEHGKIYLSERGGPFRELDLGDTEEAAELARLLGQLTPEGTAAAVPVGRQIVADGGYSVSRPKPAGKPRGGR
jgi:hypothetical protein